MQIDVIQTPGREATLVRLIGQLAMDTADSLREATRRLGTETGHRVVVDLSGVDFCDSIGLSAFVDAQRTCTEAGGYLRLAAPTNAVARLLNVVGITDLVPMFPDVASARVGDPAARIRPTHMAE